MLPAAACQRQEPARDTPRTTGSAAPAAAPAVATTPAAPAAEVRPPVPAPPLPDPLPGTRRDITALAGAATRAAIGDLDGDGKAELVLADAATLRVVEPASGRVRASRPVPGGVLVTVAADLDGDGRAELYVGTGQTREHRATPARVLRYRLDGDQLVEEEVLAPTTSRDEVVAIVPVPGPAPELLIAYFESKYMVRSVVARRAEAGWQVTDVGVLRTATAYGRGDLDGDGRVELVVGRVYGDALGADGDAFVLASDGSRDAIPTMRGVRELAVADTDGDGRAEVFLADGWHQNYAGLARGRLTWARRVGRELRAELIEDTPGQYSVGPIVPGDLDGDGRLEVVTSGSAYVRAYRRDGDAWRGLSIAPAARAIAVGELDGAPGAEIVILADRSEIVTLRAGDW